MLDTHKNFQQLEVYLNAVSSRLGLTRPCQVGGTSELIRNGGCNTLQEWEQYYFTNAYARRKNPYKITKEKLNDLACKGYLYTQNDIPSLTLEIWQSYIYDVVINRTYDGYWKERFVKTQFPTFNFTHPKYDCSDGVDLILSIKDCKIGLQVKSRPAFSYKISKKNKEQIANFANKHSGTLFIIYCNNDKIINNEIIQQIEQEIQRLQNK